MVGSLAPPGPAPSAVRPSGWWYVVTVGIAGCGAVIAVALLVGGLRATQQAGRDLTVVELGQSGPVTFIDGGPYTLFYGGPRQATSEADVRRLAAELSPVLRPADGGPSVLMKAYEGTSAIVNDRKKNVQLVPVLTFDIDRPGEYVLTAERLEGVADNAGRVSVGKSVFAPLRTGAVWAVIVIAVAIFLSVIATVALAVTRGRAKRRAPPGWPSGPDPFGGSGWSDPTGSAPTPRDEWIGGPPAHGPWPAPAPPPPPPGY